MINLISVIRAMLENDITRTALIFYLAGTVLWIIYFLLMDKLIPKMNTIPRLISDRQYIISFLFIMLVFLIAIEALGYVGFLPYGPDTAAYTNTVRSISLTGHWLGSRYDPYYAPFHTSACLLTIFTEIVGSIQLAYFASIASFLLVFILIVGKWASKIANSDENLGIAVATLLFISSPALMGFDLLQQYVSLVYASAAVIILLTHPRRSQTPLMFFLFMILSVITHLTGAILASLLFVAAILYKKREYAYGCSAFVGTALLYFTVIVPAAYSFLRSRYLGGAPAISHATASSSLIRRLLYGNVSKFVIRAFGDVPSAKISLLSWTMVLSAATAYIILFLAVMVMKRKKGNEALKINIFSSMKEIKKFSKFAAVVFVLSMGYVFLGLLTKAVGIDVFRYAAIPSYFMLVMLLSVILTRLLAKNRVSGLVLLILLLSPYLYSSMYSPERAPWMGGSRLAPVTYIDRLELIPVAKFAGDNVRVYSWHDAYVPIEYTKAKLITGGAYYPVHALLLKVANGYDVSDWIKQTNLTPYFILPRHAIRTRAYESYDVGYMGHEHVLLLPRG